MTMLQRVLRRGLSAEAGWRKTYAQNWVMDSLKARIRRIREESEEK